MTYAQGRVYYDADSHIMELPDFLTEFADPGMRDRLPKISYAPGGRSYGGLDEALKRKAHAPEKVAELIALGDQMISGPKGYFALGAFNAQERATALDMLGFSPAAGVRHLLGRHRVLRRPAARHPLCRGARPQSRHGRILCPRRAPMGVALLPLDDHRARHRRAGARAQARIEGDVGSASAVRRPFTGTHRSRSHLGAARGIADALPAACRRSSAADRSCLDEHRPARSHRLARRRRECARQGHDIAAPQRRNLRRLPGAGRRVRAASQLARRRDRARRWLCALR